MLNELWEVIVFLSNNIKFDIGPNSELQMSKYLHSSWEPTTNSGFPIPFHYFKQFFSYVFIFIEKILDND